MPQIKLDNLYYYYLCRHTFEIIRLIYIVNVQNKNMRRFTPG